MSNIPIRDMTQTGTPDASSLIVFDNGVMRKGTVGSMADAVRPVASQGEAQAGADNAKVMTPLRVKESIATEVGVTVQGYDADLAALAGNSTDGLWAHTGSGTGSARTISASTGLAATNGNGVAGNPTIALAINGLTADASPDGAADYVLTYDASAATHKKVLLDDLPGGGGGGGVASNFNVKDPAYGAKGDTKLVAVTASITSGSPNLTATGATFGSGDVGKVIEVPGAGAAGAGLVTTILTFTDATHVVLAANASTTLTAVSQNIYYGTDDTAAIQAAMAAAYAVTGGVLGGGGNIFVPAGGYMVIGSGSSILPFYPAGGKFYGASEWGTVFYIPSSVGTSRDFMLFQGTATGIVLQDFMVYNIGATSGRHQFHFESSGGQYWRNVVFNRVWSFAPSGHNIYFNNTVGGSVFQGIIRDSNLYSSVGNAAIKVVKGGDSIFIDHNLLTGAGYAIDADQDSGAGQFTINGNNITAAGMVKISGAIAPIITFNEFEQLSTNNSTNNAMLDLVGGLDSAKVYGNQIQALVGFGNPTLIRVDNATNTVIDANRLSVPAAYAPVVITASAVNTYLGPGNYFPGSSSTITNGGTNTIYAPLSKGTPLSVIGTAGGTAGHAVDIVATNLNQVLRADNASGVLSFGQVLLSGSPSGVTGVLPVANGGTGLSAFSRTRQTFTSGTAATYTRPANVKYIVVRMIGGGGGGGGGGAAGGSRTPGTTGNNTTFSTFTAGGGGPGLDTGPGGVGGTGTGGNLNQQGNAGLLECTLGTGAIGGQGAGSIFGGGGGGGSLGGAGGAAGTNSGGGGGGGGSTSSTTTGAGGGGSGAYVEALITSPSATYTYTVGAAVSGGAAGTNGGAGGGGAAGIIIVDEFY